MSVLKCTKPDVGKGWGGRVRISGNAVKAFSDDRDAALPFRVPDPDNARDVQRCQPDAVWHVVDANH